ncbi:MAG: dockerin type I repeat-containing protein [Oscillospiraceae bacterium]|nr:dockerin type I repeat-containing protein [Oscillospiraceae bacterium]
MKRKIAAILAGLLCFASTPVTAFAVGREPISIETDTFSYYTTSADSLNKMGAYWHQDSTDRLVIKDTEANFLITGIYQQRDDPSHLLYTCIYLPTSPPNQMGRGQFYSFQEVPGSETVQVGDLIYIESSCMESLPPKYGCGGKDATFTNYGNACDLLGEEFVDVLRHEVVLSQFYGIGKYDFDKYDLLPVSLPDLNTSGKDLPYYWGDTTWDALEGYETIDDHGLYTGKTGYQNAEVYLNEESAGWRGIILVKPRTHTLRFVLQDGVDVDDGAQQMAEVIDTYYPGILAQYDAERHYSSVGNIGQEGFMQFYQVDNYSDTVSRVFELQTPENSAQAEAGILLALAKKHLLSEFYGFGETAYFEMGYLEGGKVLDYASGESFYDEQKQTEVTKETYWDTVQAYLTEHYPGLTVESYDPQDGGSNRYRINGAEDWNYRDQMELMFELWEQFRIDPQLSILETAESSATRRNALLKRGDVTLDTGISIVDIIALNRNIMIGDPLCETAKQNADINGNGAPDETDALAILKEIVEITEGFAEKQN